MSQNFQPDPVAASLCRRSYRGQDVPRQSRSRFCVLVVKWNKKKAVIFTGRFIKQCGEHMGPWSLTNIQLCSNMVLIRIPAHFSHFKKSLSLIMLMHLLCSNIQVFCLTTWSHFVTIGYDVFIFYRKQLKQLLEEGPHVTKRRKSDGVWIPTDDTELLCLCCMIFCSISSLQTLPLYEQAKPSIKPS